MIVIKHLVDGITMSKPKREPMQELYDIIKWEEEKKYYEKQTVIFINDVKEALKGFGFKYKDIREMK